MAYYSDEGDAEVELEGEGTLIIEVKHWRSKIHNFTCREDCGSEDPLWPRHAGLFKVGKWDQWERWDRKGKTPWQYFIFNRDYTRIAMVDGKYTSAWVKKPICDIKGKVVNYIFAPPSLCTLHEIPVGFFKDVDIREENDPWEPRDDFLIHQKNERNNANSADSPGAAAARLPVRYRRTIPANQGR
jgi:hypothetical protein